MAFKSITSVLVLFILLSIIFNHSQCSSSRLLQTQSIDTLYTNQTAKGVSFQLVFQKGKAHNHPILALWTTDTNNNYIETLYISESIAKGMFRYGDNRGGKWMPGEIRRPAALPVWSHSRGVKEIDGLYVPTTKTQMPDAISGATPQHNFVIETKVSDKTPRVFYVYFEINQSWDWNKHWTNNKYPNDAEYKTSCQPALVYQIVIDSEHSNRVVQPILVGRSSHNGADGKVYKDLQTITSAKHIVSSLELGF